MGGSNTHTTAASTTAATTVIRPRTLDDFLEFDDLELAGSETPDRTHDRLRRLDVRDARDAFAEAGEPHRPFVVQRLPAEGGVEDELDLVVLDEVDGVGAAFADLEHRLRVDPLVGEVLRG